METRSKHCLWQTRMLLMVVLAIALATWACIMMLTSPVQDYETSALMDGEMTVEQVKDLIPPPHSVRYVSQSYPTGRLTIGVGERSDPQSHRDPADPAPLVGFCPIPEQPTFCYKDGGK